MISDVYFPRINGVSTSIQTFRQCLTNLGHEVSLVAPDYGVSYPDQPDTTRVASRRVVLDPEDRFMSTRQLRALVNALSPEQFDLVHVQTPFLAHYYGVAMARAMGVPCVETYHTYFEEYFSNYVRFMPRAASRAVARRLSRSQCNALDAVVVPSQPIAEVLRHYGVRRPIHVIPTGVDHASLPPGDGARFRANYGIDHARPTLVHVGRIAHEKNIDFLLHVLVEVQNRIPDVLLIIAGEGPARAHLQALAARLGLAQNVLFVGYLSRDQQLSDCYCAGDAFVFASRTETQGLVLLEAMALGVPVVSTAVLGTRDILDAGKGALVAREDLTDFAGKILSLLKDGRLRAELAAEGPRFVLEWSPQAMTARLCECYDSVLDAQPQLCAARAD